MHCTWPMLTWSPGEQRRCARRQMTQSQVAVTLISTFRSGAFAAAKGANIGFGDVSGGPVRGPISAQRHLYSFHLMSWPRRWHFFIRRNKLPGKSFPPDLYYV